MVNILKKVDISSLVEAKAIQVLPGKFQVIFSSLEPGKDIIFDTKALQTLNEKLTERCEQLNANDKNTKPYIEEFAMRIVAELYGVGLCVLEDIPEAPDSPYQNVKKALLERS